MLKLILYMTARCINHIVCVLYRMVIEPVTETQRPSSTFDSVLSDTDSEFSDGNMSVIKLFVQRHSPTRHGRTLSLYEFSQLVLPYVGLTRGSAYGSQVMKFIHQSLTSCEMAFEKEVVSALKKLTFIDEFDANILELFNE